MASEGISSVAGEHPPLAGKVATSIVVPMYNEEHRLRTTLPQLVALASRDVEVLLVDDGSTDATERLLAAHASHPRVRILREPRNRGKGAAVRRGVLESSGRTIVFMDADLATDVSTLEPLLVALEHADIAIGSRAHDEAVLQHLTPVRTRLGRQFNRFVRTFTKLELRDTQCGFKAFRAPVAKMLFRVCRINGFAFDVEFLSLAQRVGFEIAEVPVMWTEMPGSKVRPIADPLKMAFDVMRTRVQGRGRQRVAGVELRPDPGCMAATVAKLRAFVCPETLLFVSNDRVWVLLSGVSPQRTDQEMERIVSLVPNVDATCGLVPLRAIAQRTPPLLQREPPDRTPPLGLARAKAL